MISGLIKNFVIFEYNKMVKTSLIVLLSIILVLITGTIIYLIIKKRKCSNKCDGTNCGYDDCGNNCECNQGGVCQNGSCCYPNCNGLNCGDDGCGNKCTCNYTKAGIYQKGICGENDRCCYPRDHNFVFCGDDGCGGIASCQTGSTCINNNCVNPGVVGWGYDLSKITDYSTKQFATAQDCASWTPDNEKVYQYWSYDTSKQTCYKIPVGEKLCGIQNQYMTSFDVIENQGPDKEPCKGCNLSPKCPSTGPDACCPLFWNKMNDNSSYCLDLYNQLQCCLNNGASDYNQCLNMSVPCEQKPGVYWQTFDYQIDNQCDPNVTGMMGISGLHSNLDPSICQGKVGGDKCSFSNGQVSYTGICKSCVDGKTLQCLPEQSCIATDIGLQPGVQGTCNSQNLCGI